MTVRQIADKLNACGNGSGCSSCKYRGMSNCEHHLIHEMGEEVKKIVAEEEKKDGNR